MCSRTPSSPSAAASSSVRTAASGAPGGQRCGSGEPNSPRVAVTQTTRLPIAVVRAMSAPARYVSSSGCAHIDRIVPSGSTCQSWPPRAGSDSFGVPARGSAAPSVIRTARRLDDPLLEVLTGVRDGVDGPSSLDSLLAADEGADVNDSLALLAGDAGPVVGVGGVGQILVLLELVDACGEQVRDAQPLLVDLEIVLDGHLLGPVDDVLDHRTGVEVLEVEDLLVTVGIGDLEEPVLLDLGVHPLDSALDHGVDGAVPRATVLCEVIGVQR